MTVTVDEVTSFIISLNCKMAFNYVFIRECARLTKWYEMAPMFSVSEI